MCVFVFLFVCSFVPYACLLEWHFLAQTSLYWSKLTKKSTRLLESSYMSNQHLNVYHLQGVIPSANTAALGCAGLHAKKGVILFLWRLDVSATQLSWGTIRSWKSISSAFLPAILFPPETHCSLHCCVLYCENASRSGKTEPAESGFT